MFKMCIMTLLTLFEMKMHICWTEDGKQMKLKTWGGEQFSRTTGWKFLEVPSTQSLHSKRLEKEMCRPMTLEDIEAQWHVWSTGPRIVRPDLDVAACTSGKKMAHPKIEDEWDSSTTRPGYIDCAFMMRKVGDLHSFYTREEAESKEKAWFSQCIWEAPTRRSDSGCKGTHSKTTAEEAGFNARRCVATDLRLQSVCLIDRDQRLMQRV